MTDKTKTLIFVAGAIVVGLVNGLFGGGGGLIAILLLKLSLKLDDKVSHATTTIAMGIVSLPTFITYCATIPFNIWLTVLVAIGTIIGSIFGSMLLKKISPKVLNALLILVILASGIKCFF